MDKVNFVITLGVIILLFTLSELTLAQPLVSSAAPASPVPSAELPPGNPPGVPAEVPAPAAPQPIASPVRVEVDTAPTSVTPTVTTSSPGALVVATPTASPTIVTESPGATAGSVPTTLPPGVNPNNVATTNTVIQAAPPPNVPSETPPMDTREASQFQNWLQTNTKEVIVKPGPPVSIRHDIPPPPFPLKHRVVLTQPLCGRGGPIVTSPPISYKRSQEMMLKLAPSSPPPSPDAIVAFKNMMAQHMPLTPRQVVQLRQLIDKSQRAAAIPPNIPPKPVSSTLMINLAPGATPPAIRLAQGYVSSLVFVDASGSPWPIAGFEVGDPRTTTIQWDGKSNIIFMQAVSPYSEGNLVVRLVGLLTPITLEIVSGQRVVDYRTDIHVPGFGPNSKDFSTGTALPSSANQLLLSVLDGVAPPGSRELTVKGGEAQVWLVDDTMYLRTRLTLLSPGWVGKMSSPDGMIAYELQRTSSILVSQYGNPVELKIEGF